MRIFFDVDTQNDFMKSDGALYVPGAEALIPKVNELTALAMRYNIQILGSVDTHFGDEEHKDVEKELNKWGGPFPDHCMKDTTGWEKINEDLFPRDTIVPTDGLECGMVPDGAFGYAVLTRGDPTLFEKQTYDVFTNSHLEPTLRRLNVTEAFVYGVATDYCVKAAVIGLRRLGISVVVIADVIAAVTPEGGKEAMARMAGAGAYAMPMDYLVKHMEAIYAAV